MSWLKDCKRESTPFFLDLYIRKVEDTFKMLRQAIEEDTGCAWEPEMFWRFLNCYSIEDGKKLYDEVMKYSYDHSASKGITLQQMLYERIIDHNAIVSLWEKDKDDSQCSAFVWKGMFWKLPEEYKNRIGQIHSVISSWGDDIHIELAKE